MNVRPMYCSEFGVYLHRKKNKENEHKTIEKTVKITEKEKQSTKRK